MELRKTKQRLHTAIDQVWGGIFAVSVRREHERQAQAAADAKKVAPEATPNSSLVQHLCRVPTRNLKRP